MDEIEKKYFSIGEVAALINESPSLIRFWETEFSQLKPRKSDGGTRKYSGTDVELLKLIHHLVKEKGYTLDGARQYLKSSKRPLDDAALLARLHHLRHFLEELRRELDKQAM